jgi:uncharacterized protein (DUF1501 family)
VNRRSFLAGLAGAGVATVGGTYAAGRMGADERGASLAPVPPTSAPPAATTTTTIDPGPAIATPAVGRRRLVVLEMAGGIDGLSTLVPAAQGAYRDLRPTLARPDEELLWWDDEVALHGNLARLHGRGLAAIEGIGSVEPRGSHFGMIARWWAGQVESDAPSRTGFFGRLCDALGDPTSPFVGVCVGTGKHAAMASETVNTLGLPSIDAAPYLAGPATGDDFRSRFQSGLAAMATGVTGEAFFDARRTLQQAVNAAGRLQGLAPSSVTYPSTELGGDLQTAARLLAAEQDVRVVYVPIHLNFDTHVNHVETHATNLSIIDEALDVFLSDVEQRGMGDEVLVATVSEFGRRARENGEAGLDHGAASVVFLAGAVQPGRYGEYSSLTDLDADGNLRPTVTFDRYYATLAESWFGVPAGELLAGNPRPLDVRF